MTPKLDSARYTRVFSNAITGFNPEFEESENLTPYCEGTHPSTKGIACPFIEICSRRIVNGQLPLARILEGATHSETIAHIWNNYTNNRVPADIFTGDHMKASFIGMLANCTDTSTKAFEVPSYAKDAVKNPNFGKRQKWQDESGGWGGDK